ncbi:MgtE intracellular region [Desulfurispirillum indicum S5]|uniref:MgtE intracellular region n=1 Tax=Desulfurispirillum indicum (strain ATCC BAA-1389 / DSM 22839 / S5) TaxID=653733 RepID=E6W3Q1_DESIS|nr:MgtE intracellular region [Desulfurispirillum indicum]ADU66932.1 MgtE intracellular region [Desulfurispirillum indicum S5]
MKTLPRLFVAVYMLIILGLFLSAASSVRAEERSFSGGYESEINVDKVIQNLRQREEELNRRESNLQAREQQLQQLQREVNGQINRLEALRGNIEELIGMIDNERQQRLQNVASIYETMKPREAAAVVSELPAREAADIFAAMPPRTAGGILQALGRLNPAHAARISHELKTVQGFEELQQQF